MEPRVLAPTEATLLLQALVRQERLIRDGLSEAASDNKIDDIRQRFAALMLCDDLQRSVRAGHFRVIQG